MAQIRKLPTDLSALDFLLHPFVIVIASHDFHNVVVVEVNGETNFSTRTETWCRTYKGGTNFVFVGRTRLGRVRGSYATPTSDR
jgi:hypothetical protein